ncbi:hypothetical protein BGZ54_004181, partial [Gamsiella multidivaricata]
MTKSIQILFILDGEATTRAIELTLPLSASGAELILAIKNRLPLDFEGTSGQLLTVWRVAVPKDAGTAHEPVVLSNIKLKQDVHPSDKLLELVKADELGTYLTVFVATKEVFPLTAAVEQSLTASRKAALLVIVKSIHSSYQLQWFREGAPSLQEYFELIFSEYPGLADETASLAMQRPNSKDEYDLCTTDQIQERAAATLLNDKQCECLVINLTIQFKQLA